MRHLSNAVLVLVLPFALSACGDPLNDIERLSDVELAAEGLTVAAIPPPEEQSDAPGLLSRVFAGTLTTGPTLPPAVEAAVAEAVEGETPLAPDLVSSADIPPGLEGDPLAGTDAIPGDTEMADASQPEPAAPRRRGLFGLLNVASAAAPSPGTGPDAMQIAPGETLAYGQIATVCGLSGAALGTPVAQASGYTVHDTNPTSTGQRTHYITGFDDNCARQFQAALALFGDVGTHELVRYSQGAGELAYSGTDAAYEAIKGQVCGVASGQPCGGALDRLARRTTFLTVYANFASNPEWAEILLSDGQVIAMDFEG